MLSSLNTLITKWMGAHDKSGIQCFNNINKGVFIDSDFSIRLFCNRAVILNSQYTFSWIGYHITHPNISFFTHPLESSPQRATNTVTNC